MQHGRQCLERVIKWTADALVPGSGDKGRPEPIGSSKRHDELMKVDEIAKMCKEGKTAEAEKIAMDTMANLGIK